MCEYKKFHHVWRYAVDNKPVPFLYEPIVELRYTASILIWQKKMHTKTAQTRYQNHIIFTCLSTYLIARTDK